MDLLEIDCAEASGNTLVLELEADVPTIILDDSCGVITVALSVESATKLRDALTDWLGGQV